jgi:long-subunit fatty acid transport protein
MAKSFFFGSFTNQLLKQKMTTRNRELVHFIFFIIFASINSSSVFAGGFAVPQQTAKAAALSNAVTAGIDDPSAVYTNPAGLAFVKGNQILANGIYINAISSVKNSGQTARNYTTTFLSRRFLQTTTYPRLI